MERNSLRECATEAIRYWEPRRLLYNLALALVVLIYFFRGYPASKTALSLDFALSVFLLAVLANVAYCVAYVPDIFAQMTGYRFLWLKYRWILLAVGILFAGTITRFFSMAMFLSAPNR
jgi:hypothetical protein